ncbi:MAG TPA: hypothetical protein GX735_02130 [Firmicutes bacterium]|jgi:hypothetical protein|nr:hypothetical protein [Bacillota bacterium]
MDRTEPVSCLICNGNGPGLDIRGKHICSRCEELLLYLPVGNSLYEYCKERVKLIWADLNTLVQYQ